MKHTFKQYVESTRGVHGEYINDEYEKFMINMIMRKVLNNSARVPENYDKAYSFIESDAFAPYYDMYYDAFKEIAQKKRDSFFNVEKLSSETQQAFRHFKNNIQTIYKDWLNSKKIKESESTTIQLNLADTGPAKKWIEKVYARYPYRFGRNHVMAWGNGDDQTIALFELGPDNSLPNAVEIKWFQAEPQKSGVGKKAMKILQDMAREDGITLTLFPWDKGRTSQATLIKIYKKMGFKQTSSKSKNMILTPTSLNEIHMLKSSDYTGDIDGYVQSYVKQLTQTGNQLPGFDKKFKYSFNNYEKNGHIIFIIDTEAEKVVSEMVLEPCTKKWQPPLENAFIVTGISTDPEYRRQGLAMALYKLALLPKPRGLGVTLVSGEMQTPAGRRNWYNLSKMPGIEITGFVAIPDNENTPLDIFDDLLGKVGGVYIKSSKETNSTKWHFYEIPVGAVGKRIDNTLRSSKIKIYGRSDNGLIAKYIGE